MNLIAVISIIFHSLLLLHVFVMLSIRYLKYETWSSFSTYVTKGRFVLTAQEA